MKRVFISASAAIALLAPLQLFAHHSFAIFDHDKDVELKDATVVEWQWTNPHTWLYVLVPNGTTTPTKYAIEGNNPAQLRRQGFGINTFKPGDKVTLYIWPLHSGEPGGAMRAAALPDGTTVGDRNSKPVE
jgi:Family of unknown function (DUF6152)